MITITIQAKTAEEIREELARLAKGMGTSYTSCEERAATVQAVQDLQELARTAEEGAFRVEEAGQGGEEVPEVRSEDQED